MPNATNWSFLWAMECKDYKGSLSVSDIEEFHGKIQQIAGDNVKATLIVSGALQRSAFEYCKSLGIGVVRLLPDDQIYNVLQSVEMLYDSEDQGNAKEAEIDSDRQIIETETNKNLEAITEPEFASNWRNFYALQDNRFYDDWFSLLNETLQPSLKR